MSPIPTLSRRRLAVVALFVAGFALPVAAGLYSRGT